MCNIDVWCQSLLDQIDWFDEKNCISFFCKCFQRLEYKRDLDVVDQTIDFTVDCPLMRDLRNNATYFKHTNL